MLWVVGMLTSLLTAIYMFRLVFLTFHGERRTSAGRAAAHPEEEEPARARAHRRTTHRHRGTWPRRPRHAPARRAAGDGARADRAGDRLGRRRLRRRAARARRQQSARALPRAELRRAARAGRTSAAPASGVRPQAEQRKRAEPAHGSELGADGASRAGRARRHRHRVLLLPEATARRATRWPSSFSGLHRLLLNKYYVDEIYDAAIVQPIRIVSEEGLWKVVDVRVIDGAVNGVGDAVGGSERAAAAAADRLGPRLRGVAVPRASVLILGYYLWRDDVDWSTVDGLVSVPRCMLSPIVLCRSSAAARWRCCCSSARRSDEQRAAGPQHRAGRVAAGVRARRCCCGPLRRRRRPTSSSSSATPGFRRSASSTTSASTASACCCSSSPAS